MPMYFTKHMARVIVQNLNDSKGILFCLRLNDVVDLYRLNCSWKFQMYIACDVYVWTNNYFPEQ